MKETDRVEAIYVEMSDVTDDEGTILYVAVEDSAGEMLFLYTMADYVGGLHEELLGEAVFEELVGEEVEPVGGGYIRLEDKRNIEKWISKSYGLVDAYHLELFIEELGKQIDSGVLD